MCSYRTRGCRQRPGQGEHSVEHKQRQQCSQACSCQASPDCCSGCTFPTWHEQSAGSFQRSGLLIRILLLPQVLSRSAHSSGPSTAPQGQHGRCSSSPSHGRSFPHSIVPCAFSHSPSPYRGCTSTCAKPACPRAMHPVPERSTCRGVRPTGPGAAAAGVQRQDPRLGAGHAQAEQQEGRECRAA